jgi:hypothetical protein
MDKIVVKSPVTHVPTCNLTVCDHTNIVIRSLDEFQGSSQYYGQ